MTSTTDDNECPICCGPISSPIQLQCCKKQFCNSCIENWRPHLLEYVQGRRTCPCCRTLIPPTKEIVELILFFTQVSNSIRRMRQNQHQELSKLPFRLQHNVCGDTTSREVLEAEYERLEMVYRQPTRIFECTYGQNYKQILQSNPPKPKKLPRVVAKAVLKNDVRAVTEFLGPVPIPPRRLNAICPSKNGNTLLHFAVQANNLEIVNDLLALGANVNAVDYSGKTPLHIAATMDGIDATVARTLLRWGAKKEAALPKGKLPILAAEEAMEKRMFPTCCKHHTAGDIAHSRNQYSIRYLRGPLQHVLDNSSDIVQLRKHDFLRYF